MGDMKRNLVCLGADHRILKARQAGKDRRSMLQAWHLWHHFLQLKRASTAAGRRALENFITDFNLTTRPLTAAYR
jgi:hypothetical protein